MSVIDRIEALERRIERLEDEIGLVDGYSVCQDCGYLFSANDGPGRPRRFCLECRPPART